MPRTTKKTTPLTLTFSSPRETKNTVVFTEEVEGDAKPVCGKIYVKKESLSGLGDPESIVVTIAAA